MCALVACSGQQRDPGTDAGLSVRGGTFVRGSLPAAQAGPAVESAFLGQTMFPVGHQNKTFSGSLGASATAVTIALVGDVGYWIVPAGAPLVEAPTLPSFDAPLSFGASAQAGPQELELAAVDGAERFGAPRRVAFTLTSRQLDPGQLIFSLYWDRPSDLDLHVVLPDGTEVYKDERNSWEPSAASADDPQAFEAGGILDLDSNAQCRIDGHNNENVRFEREPPPGKYLVRVDTFSLCDEASARWSVEARYHGQRVALSHGQSTSTDTRGAHGLGAGITAFELQVE
jgi:hypothetical protein